MPRTRADNDQGPPSVSGVPQSSSSAPGEGQRSPRPETRREAQPTRADKGKNRESSPRPPSAQERALEADREQRRLAYGGVRRRRQEQGGDDELARGGEGDEPRTPPPDLDEGPPPSGDRSERMNGPEAERYFTVNEPENGPFSRHTFSGQASSLDWRLAFDDNVKNVQKGVFYIGLVCGRLDKYERATIKLPDWPQAVIASYSEMLQLRGDRAFRAQTLFQGLLALLPTCSGGDKHGLPSSALRSRAWQAIMSARDCEFLYPHPDVLELRPTILETSVSDVFHCLQREQRGPTYISDVLARLAHSVEDVVVQPSNVQIDRLGTLENSLEGILVMMEALGYKFSEHGQPSMPVDTVWLKESALYRTEGTRRPVQMVWDEWTASTRLKVVQVLLILLCASDLLLLDERDAAKFTCPSTPNFLQDLRRPPNMEDAILRSALCRGCDDPYTARWKRANEQVGQAPAAHPGRASPPCLLDRHQSPGRRAEASGPEGDDGKRKLDSWEQEEDLKPGREWAETTRRQPGWDWDESPSAGRRGGWGSPRRHFGGIERGFGGGEREAERTDEIAYGSRHPSDIGHKRPRDDEQVARVAAGPSSSQARLASGGRTIVIDPPRRNIQQPRSVDQRQQFATSTNAPSHGRSDDPSALRPQRVAATSLPTGPPPAKRQRTDGPRSRRDEANNGQSLRN